MMLSKPHGRHHDNLHCHMEHLNDTIIGKLHVRQHHSRATVGSTINTML